MKYLVFDPNVLRVEVYSIVDDITGYVTDGKIALPEEKWIPLLQENGALATCYYDKEQDALYPIQMIDIKTTAVTLSLDEVATIQIPEVITEGIVYIFRQYGNVTSTISSDLVFENHQFDFSSALFGTYGIRIVSGIYESNIIMIEVKSV